MRTGAAGALAVLALLAAGPAGAEDPPFDATRDGPKVIANLKATPASLFDLSMARLEAQLGALDVVHKFGANANYQDDRIQIYAYDTARPATVAKCKEIFDIIRGDAGVDLKTGFAEEPATLYASFFSYPAIDEFKVSETYAETVDSIIAIKVVLGVSGDGKALVCDGPLLGKDFKHIND